MLDSGGTVKIEVEQLEDWVSLDATKRFKKTLEELYSKIVNQAVDKQRSDSRDEAIDTAKGVKLALKELEIFMEGDSE